MAFENKAVFEKFPDLFVYPIERPNKQNFVFRSSTKLNPKFLRGISNITSSITFQTLAVKTAADSGSLVRLRLTICKIDPLTVASYFSHSKSDANPEICEIISASSIE